MEEVFEGEVREDGEINGEREATWDNADEDGTWPDPEPDVKTPEPREKLMDNFFTVSENGNFHLFAPNKSKFPIKEVYVHEANIDRFIQDIEKAGPINCLSLDVFSIFYINSLIIQHNIIQVWNSCRRSRSKNRGIFFITKNRNSQTLKQLESKFAFLIF